MTGTPKLIEGPFAWTGAEMAARRDWIEVLTAEEIAELERAVESVTQCNLEPFDIRKKDFPLPKLAPRLEKILREIEEGRGMVMIRGIPVERFTEQQTQYAFWGIGLHLGVPLSQSSRGDLLGEVQDEGVKPGAIASRGYRGNHALPFHTDRADFAALLCVRPAKSGGVSRVVSSVAVHNEMLKRRPDLVEALYQPFYMSRQGDLPPGQDNYYVAPVFGMRDGKFSSQLAPSYIRLAQTFPDIPRLSAAQQEALELLSSLSQEMAFDTDFHFGDLQIINNHVTYHGRTGFEDFDDPQKKRKLLRLWLSSPIGRPLPENSVTLWGSVEPGATRGGVLAKDGWWRDALSRQSMAERELER